MVNWPQEVELPVSGSRQARHAATRSYRWRCMSHSSSMARFRAVGRHSRLDSRTSQPRDRLPASASARTLRWSPPISPHDGPGPTATQHWPQSAEGPSALNPVLATGPPLRTLPFPSMCALAHECPWQCCSMSADPQVPAVCPEHLRWPEQPPRQFRRAPARSATRLVRSARAVQPAAGGQRVDSDGYTACRMEDPNCRWRRTIGYRRRRRGRIRARRTSTPAHRTGMSPLGGYAFQWCKPLPPPKGHPTGYVAASLSCAASVSSIRAGNCRSPGMCHHPVDRSASSSYCWSSLGRPSSRTPAEDCDPALGGDTGVARRCSRHAEFLGKARYLAFREDTVDSPGVCPGAKDQGAGTCHATLRRTLSDTPRRSGR